MIEACLSSGVSSVGPEISLGIFQPVTNFINAICISGAGGGQFHPMSYKITQNERCDSPLKIYYIYII